jgi:hypothetical protein
MDHTILKERERITVKEILMVFFIKTITHFLVVKVFNEGSQFF